jgi:chaperone modulatory protein CbpM
MSERAVIVGIALEEPCLTLEQLAAACAVEREWLERLVREGFLDPMEGPAESWRFGAAAIHRARRIRRIERDFDAAPELAALVADMLEQIDLLRAELELRRIR